MNISSAKTIVGIVASVFAFAEAGLVLAEKSSNARDDYKAKKKKDKEKGGKKEK